MTGKSKIDFEYGNSKYITFLNVMYNPIIDETTFESVWINPGEIQNKALKGDLFFNTSSETPEEVGMCSVLDGDIDNLYLNSFCFGYRLKSNHEVDQLYLVYYLRSEFGRKLFYSLAQGATRYNLSKSNFNKIEFPMPTIDEQRAITQILNDMDNEIFTMEKKRKKFIDIKQGMMQELLTGKTRLV